jgi:hypothetical protein
MCNAVGNSMSNGARFTGTRSGDDAGWTEQARCGLSLLRI